MGNQSEKSSVAKVDTLVFHWRPDIEVVLFYALLQYRRIRDLLNISTGVIKLLPISSGISQKALQKLLEGVNAIRFDVGGGEADQHGDERNATISLVSSLTKLIERADFRRFRPWICEVVERVSKNDTHGISVSKRQERGRKPKREATLRDLISGLNTLFPQEPEIVLKWGAQVFYAMFERIRYRKLVPGFDWETIFDESALMDALDRSYGRQPEILYSLRSLIAQAKEALADHWRIAKKAVKMAEQAGQTAKVLVSGYGQVRVIWVCSNSIRVGAAAREGWRRNKQQDYQVVIQLPALPDEDDGLIGVGGCQIYCNSKKIKGNQQLWLHFGKLVAALRRAEAAKRGREIAPDQDLESSGMVVFKDDTDQTVPWYFPEFKTAVLNRSLTAPDVSETELFPEEIMDVVKKALPECDTIIQEADGERTIQPNPGQSESTGPVSADDFAHILAAAMKCQVTD